jgi:flagellar biosynthetic protein FlhB
MSEQLGEKTEQPTPRKLEEALSKGQIARSPEVQTAAVLLAGVAALSFAGHDIWKQLVGAMVFSLGHLHDTPITPDCLQAYAVTGSWVLLQCVFPVLIATVLGGLLAGAIQNRFNTASEALTPDWNRLNPVEGFKKIFSVKMVAPTAVSMAKLVAILLLTYSEVLSILNDPIFTTSVGIARVASFLAETGMRIFIRVSVALLVIAAADYAYQWYRNQREMMMTKQEVKDDMKNSEGNPKMKNMRRRRRNISQKKMMADVTTADVVVTNPTHIAVALRYDRKAMRAPRVVAKGIRLTAERIREIARSHNVPIIENRPLARMLFKHSKVGGEIPASLYAAVAEVLAWVYRVNRYRYYTEQNQIVTASHG